MIYNINNHTFFYKHIYHNLTSHNIENMFYHNITSHNIENLFYPNLTSHNIENLFYHNLTSHTIENLFYHNLTSHNIENLLIILITESSGYRSVLDQQSHTLALISHNLTFMHVLINVFVILYTFQENIALTTFQIYLYILVFFIDSSTSSKKAQFKNIFLYMNSKNTSLWTCDKEQTV